MLADRRSWSVDLMGLAISRRHGRRHRSPAACSRPSTDDGHLVRRHADRPLRHLRPVGLRRLHQRPRQRRRSSSSAPSTARSAGRPRSSSPASAAGSASTAGWSSRPTCRTSPTTRSSRRSTRHAQPPADPMDELRELTALLPAAARATSGSPPASASPASPSSTASPCVAVSFGDGLEIDLLGLARMALPRPQAALVSIELALLARFSTSEGVFMIQAAAHRQLVAALPEDVRLTGGFALRDLVEGPARRPVRADHRRLPPGLPPRRLPGRAAARAGVAGQRRHRDQGRVATSR